ncbi:hypothetical protein LTR53_013618 [Teratosphaeriaceae sp. CCFEE 6253]|nr:hypothetical protein LTR53_013618 [Teratosphaeriaceae sp. CCFEE 6253]
MAATNLDTPITIKIVINDTFKKIKLPLRDLGANSLPDKLRHILDIKPEQHVVFERFSDSAGGFIVLDPNNPQVFKTLIRAAKAKLKLRLKATVTPLEPKEEGISEVEAPAQPTIVHSPVPTPQQRDSMAFDRRSVGSGIFPFIQARASQQTLVNVDEAPVPHTFAASQKDFFNDLVQTGVAPKVQQISAPVPIINHGHPWSVYCDNCDKAMADAHFHCSICSGGDYDLCEECVASGALCQGEDHWLIKRFIKNGKVINSTTERISPRASGTRKSIKLEDLLKPLATTVDVEKQMPGAFAEDTKTLAPEALVATRTCNSCVVVLPEREFITCSDCDDFDLCINCHTSNKHGHHPAHGFQPATEDTVLPLHAEAMLSPGRNVRHNAICDGCENPIYGVRHKCLNCPDWDYCTDCVKSARHIHPRHRFAAIYQPIPDQMQPQIRHFGIYCDGPLCRDQAAQTYITGVRYKCAVCHDTDFCASCEAIPSNHHNRTHPLIKFKTPVRNVSITTENEDLRGNVRMMGDRRGEKSVSTETTPVPEANTAVQVQTMAEIKPEPTLIKEEAQPIPVVKPQAPKSPLAEAAVSNDKLNAHFVQDSIADSTVMLAGARFTQIWTLRNPGPYAWPAGCSVRYVGGDNMLNVDNGHPASVTDLADATESNVVGREVQVGEEVAFKVVLKAPLRSGKSISYWRVKAADGTPFGHRLWCDIVVKTPDVPLMNAMLAQPIEPTAVAPIPSVQHQQQLQQQQLKLAQMSRMQAMRQQQQTMMRAQMEMLQQKQQQQAQQNVTSNAANMGAPPAYTESNETLDARLAAMRLEQQKRREQMVAQLSAKREAMHGRTREFLQASRAVAAEADSDKLRKESAKQRVEYIKAKIMRTREEQRAKIEAQKQSAASAEQKSAEETKEVKKTTEDVSKDAAQVEQPAAAVDEDNMERSQMVFPKLDKESPSSSTYQSATSSSTFNKGKAAYVENEAGEVERSAAPYLPVTLVQAPAAIAEPSVPSPMMEEDYEDLSNEIEVLSATAGDLSEDDGFLTDEEYDILDASDNETVASK